MKSVAFHLCPKNHYAYGILMIEIMSPRTFKNRRIWSHWRRKIDVGAVSRKGRRLKRKFAVSRFCKENRKHFSIFLLDKKIYLQFLFLANFEMAEMAAFGTTKLLVTIKNWKTLKGCCEDLALPCVWLPSYCTCIITAFGDLHVVGCVEGPRGC